jgi:chemotaxis protein MotA
MVLAVTLLLGGELQLFINVPSIVFVVLGTLSAGIASFPVDVALRTVKPIRMALVYRRVNFDDFIDFFEKLTISFRKDGFFGLEKALSETQKLPYDGIRRAVMLAMEVSDTKTLKEILEVEKKSYLEDIDNAIALTENLGTLAPAFGLLGTVIGLIYMLANLKDPSRIGSGLAVALLTTFYGLILSNMFFSTLTSRLKHLRSREEVLLTVVERTIILMLQGLSPRLIKESLVESLVQGKAKIKVEDEEKKG